MAHQLVTNNIPEEEEEEGEDFPGEDMINDYRPLKQLDRYEVDEAAENDQVEEMSVAARRRAGRKLRERNRENRRRNARDAGQMNNDDSDSDEEGEAGFEKRRAPRQAILARHRNQRQTGYGSLATGQHASAAGGEDDTPALSFGNEDNAAPDEPFDLDNNAYEGQSIATILQEKGAKKEFSTRFSNFLRNYTDDKNDSHIYMDRIRPHSPDGREQCSEFDNQLQTFLCR